MGIKISYCLMLGCFDVCEDDVIVSSPRAVDQENGRNEGESSGQSCILPQRVISEHKKVMSSSVLAENALSPSILLVTRTGEPLLKPWNFDIIVVALLLLLLFIIYTCSVTTIFVYGFVLLLYELRFLSNSSCFHFPCLIDGLCGAV
ncbi:uncharacterized protein LOC121253218 isoform X1 [Juglans microcarpa x Juglans regia]|uniref:uncharacterized protein LOC121253218 isoform X1 n=1 Tax=Juglans microcarpa x Juglans regia TaxID=2249226 RepID=UPI001B7F1433|nr:uncharacterized protein LOC121253218 isoform X1 [Juglans microcarpa x Juglans regia]